MKLKGAEDVVWKEVSIAIVSIGLIVMTSKTTKERPKPSAILLAPPQNLQHLVFGYNDIVADSLWLRIVQDIDLCKAGQGALIAKTPEEMKAYSELLANSKGPRCEKGWTFRMADAITELSPKFRAPYVHVAPVLSVLTDDREGARVIYEKGVKAYPGDFKIAMGAAYHYLHEVKDEKRAAELLVQAGKNGAPEWVFSLAGQLYTKSGQAFLAKVHLTETIQRIAANEPDHPLLSRLRELLLNAEKDLEEARRESSKGGHSQAPPSTDPRHSISN